MNINKKTSDLFVELGRELNRPSVTVNSLLNTLGKKSINLCILALALPNVIPIGVPIISSLTGLVIMIAAMQQILGKAVLILPKFIGEKSISTKKIKKIIKLSLPVLKFIEKFSKPRWKNFVLISERIIACNILILGFLLFLPIPFVNFILAFYICLLSVSLLEKDGIIMISGLILSLITIGINYKLFLKAIGLTKRLLGIFY